MATLEENLVARLPASAPLRAVLVALSPSAAIAGALAGVTGGGGSGASPGGTTSGGGGGGGGYDDDYEVRPSANSIPCLVIGLRLDQVTHCCLRLINIGAAG